MQINQMSSGNSIMSERANEIDYLSVQPQKHFELWVLITVRTAS